MLPDTLHQIGERVEGALALALVDSDGMPLTSVVHDPSIDIEMLAAELMSLAADLERDHHDLATSRISGITATCERYRVLYSYVPPGFGLIMVLRRDAPVGRARFELKRAPLALTPELEG
jgi:predicted regulator of Ras-like GTPase activity (Roadblock/LC7/MglB family)